MIHRQAGFAIRVAGRIVECGTERAVHIFEIGSYAFLAEAVDSVEGQIVDDLRGELSCPSSAVQQTGTPPTAPDSGVAPTN